MEFERIQQIYMNLLQNAICASSYNSPVKLNIEVEQGQEQD